MTIAKRLDSEFDDLCTTLQILSDSMNTEGSILSLVYEEGSIGERAYCFIINTNLDTGEKACGGMIVTISDNEIISSEEISDCNRLKQLTII